MYENLTPSKFAVGQNNFIGLMYSLKKFFKIFVDNRQILRHAQDANDKLSSEHLRVLLGTKLYRFAILLSSIGLGFLNPTSQLRQANIIGF